MFRHSTLLTVMQILLDSNTVSSQNVPFGGVILEETSKKHNHYVAKLSLFHKRFLRTALLSLM